LRHNQLNSIAIVNLTGVDLLEDLALSYNKIEIRPNTTVQFKSPKSLKRLNLMGNKVSSMRNVTCAGLENLKQLDLWQNQIRNMEFINVYGLTVESNRSGHADADRFGEAGGDKRQQSIADSNKSGRNLHEANDTGEFSGESSA
jgi:Leucine-rich repeat (LRR) protein